MDMQSIYKELLDEKMGGKTKNCRNCGSIMVRSKNNKKNIYRCTWRKCNNRISYYDGTFFKFFKQSPEYILSIISMWLEGLTFNQISRVSNLSLRSINKIFLKLSKYINKSFYKDLKPIGGSDVIVEIDESLFANGNILDGHISGEIWVLGMVERSIQRRIILIPIPSRDKLTLTRLCKRFIKSESTVYTDCWGGYNDLHKHFRCHETVNHSLFFKNPITGVHTNTIEGNWSAIKRTIPTKCRTSDSIIIFLIRFMLKRNTGQSPMVELLNYLV